MESVCALQMHYLVMGQVIVVKSQTVDTTMLYQHVQVSYCIMLPFISPFFFFLSLLLICSVAHIDNRFYIIYLFLYMEISWFLDVGNGQCSGQGTCSGSPGYTCTCNSGYEGAACHLKSCPTGNAWFDEASTTNTGHAAGAVCSNRVREIVKKCRF